MGAFLVAFLFATILIWFFFFLAMILQSPYFESEKEKSRTYLIGIFWPIGFVFAMIYIVKWFINVVKTSELFRREKDEVPQD